MQPYPLTIVEFLSRTDLFRLFSYLRHWLSEIPQGMRLGSEASPVEVCSSRMVLESLGCIRFAHI